MNAPERIPLKADLPAAGRAVPHESARAQVAGQAPYVDDIAELKGTLYAAPILSTQAHGRFNGFDASAALAMPGVRGVFGAADVRAMSSCLRRTNSSRCRPSSACTRRCKPKAT